MQDKIKTAQAEVDRLSQELAKVIEESENATELAREKLSDAHVELNRLLIEADSHLPQADRRWYAPGGSESHHGRVVIESLSDDGVLQVLTTRFVGDPDGTRMQFWKMGGVWKGRGELMVLRGVPDNISEILKAAK
jgi:hypothetical protein